MIICQRELPLKHHLKVHKNTNQMRRSNPLLQKHNKNKKIGKMNSGRKATLFSFFLIKNLPFTTQQILYLSENKKFKNGGHFCLIYIDIHSMTKTPISLSKSQEKIYSFLTQLTLPSNLFAVYIIYY